MKVSLALKILGMISLFPEAHDQSTWSNVPEEVEKVTAGKLTTNPVCGTTLCFAGWATALTVPKDSFFHFGHQGGVYTEDPRGLYYQDGNRIAFADYSWEIPPKAQRYSRVDIKDFAQDALGLTRSQAGYMFAVERTVEELTRAIRKLIANPDATAYQLYDEF